MMYVFAVNCKQDIMTDFFLSWCQMTDVFLFISINGVQFVVAFDD